MGKEKEGKEDFLGNLKEFMQIEGRRRYGISGFKSFQPYAPSKARMADIAKSNLLSSQSAQSEVLCQIFFYGSSGREKPLLHLEKFVGCQTNGAKRGKVVCG